MKRLYNILLLSAIGIALLGCNSPRVIPDKVLGQIFHDALLVNAYIKQERPHDRDSLNIYEPIFEQYGYTTEDLHYTLNNFARRKSANLGNVTNHMALLLERQSDELFLQVTKQDTIDAVALRRYGSVIYHDTTIVSKTEADSTRLQISIPSTQKGMYRITGSYTLDTKDKGIGRRYTISWKRGDSLIREATNSYLMRGRKGSISTEVWLHDSDSLADNLVIDFTRFNLKKNRIKKALITIHELKVEYKPSKDDALERIFKEQSNLRIFADTMINLKLELPQPIAADTTATIDTTDSEQPIAADSVQTQTQE